MVEVEWFLEGFEVYVWKVWAFEDCKLTLVVECSCVTWRLGWKVFRSCRNDASVSAVSVHMMKMSSMYRVKVSGFIFCVCRNEVMLEERCWQLWVRMQLPLLFL